MTVSAISVAVCGPAFVDVRASRALGGKENPAAQSQRAMNIVRPKPQPGDSCDFLRSLLDDAHPSSESAMRSARDVAEDAADYEQQVTFRGRTTEDRQTEANQRRAEMRERRREIRERREAAREEVADKKLHEREISRARFEEDREDYDLHAEETIDETQLELRAIREEIIERLINPNDWGFEDDIAAEQGLFHFAESNFGDQFELSWLAQEKGGNAQDAQPSSVDSPLTPSGGLNWSG